MEPNLVTPLGFQNNLCGIHKGISKFLKGMCIFVKFYYGYNGVCFHWFIYKVVFKQINYLLTFLFICLPTC